MRIASAVGTRVTTILNCTGRTSGRGALGSTSPWWQFFRLVNHAHVEERHVDPGRLDLIGCAGEDVLGEDNQVRAHAVAAEIPTV